MVAPRRAAWANSWEGGVVRGEHDLLAPDAEPFRHLELALRRDVEAKAHVEEHLENPGVGARLHGIELAVAGVPAERVQHRPCGRAYARLVVKVERRGVRGGDVLQLACRCKGTLAAHVSSYAAILCDGPWPRSRGDSAPDFLPDSPRGVSSGPTPRPCPFAGFGGFGLPWGSMPAG